MKLVLVVFVLMLMKSANADQVCYGELGCFSDDYPFTDTMRPIPHLPWSPEEIGTEFWLYTRNNANSPQHIYYDDLSWTSNTKFRGSRQTKFIAHGFISDGGTSWVEKLKSELLSAEDVNVIVVNWDDGANPGLIYGQACANTRVVGAQIAQLVETLKGEYGITESSVHVIGHSLGAHIGGYAGENIRNLGRITGLDPAGPYFEGTQPAVRLDPTDATYVDAIHTDAQTIVELGAGIIQPVGHADFYPNGGKDQPGCPGNEHDPGNWWLVTCNHGRACDLMIDSLKNRDYPMVGHVCDTYDKYLAGQCNFCGVSNCDTMGYYSNAGSNNVEVKYFLTTGSSEPYAEV